MPVVLVVIVVVAWVVYLVARAAHRRTGDGVTSISHFHHQLRVLEHSAPAPLVAPAYRLRSGEGADGDPGAPAEPPVLTVVGADRLPRPALAFLADPPPAGGPGMSAPGTPPVTSPVAAAASPPRSGRPDPYARQLARRRRLHTLAALAAVFCVTLVVGCLPGAREAWIVSAVTACSLGAYVALLVHYRREAEERDRKLRYLDAVGAPATPVGGRFAHPSYQAAAAR